MKLELKGLRPRFFTPGEGKQAVWGKDLCLESSKIYKVVAGSGSGKSSLISFLSGLRSDYDGDLILGGKDTRDFSPKDWSEFRRKKISLVYQDLRLFSELTVLENIQISQIISYADSYDPNRDIEENLQLLNIESQRDKKVKFLSFGQMQRVAIIRAAIREYQWIILDEPFSHLDQTNARMAWELLLRQAKKRNAGIIIACLDPYEFIRADLVLYL